MNHALAAVWAATYGLDLPLLIQAMENGLEEQDLWGVTAQQLHQFLNVPPPAVHPPHALLDVAAGPDETCCSKCALMAIVVWCATCSDATFLCYGCMDACHAGHEIMRKKDVVEAWDLTGEVAAASYAKAFPPRVPLCGHRDTYADAACAKCTPLMRYDKAQCPICLDDASDMHSSCPKCANVMACQACWKTLVTGSWEKPVVCPMCRNPIA